MIEENEAGKYLDFLLAIRQCPSAFNDQTSRLTIDGDNRFTVFYAQARPNNYQNVGIELGLIYFFADGKVTFDISPEKDAKFPTGGEFICKVKVEDSVFQ